jgi:hypothetical protein
MSKVPPHIENVLYTSLTHIAEALGDEFQVALVAKNTKRPNADLVLGDPELNKQLIASAGLEVEL